MKWNTHFRLLAVGVLILFVLVGVPYVQAGVFFDSGNSLWDKLKEIEKQKAKDKGKEGRKDDGKRTQVPEGNEVALLMVGAGALGSGIVIWRRKLRANV